MKLRRSNPCEQRSFPGLVKVGKISVQCVDRMLRVSLVGLVFATSLGALAAPPSGDLATGYRDAGRCVTSALGQEWAQHFGVDLVVNAFGETEPAEESIDHAPDMVRITDLRCRREAGLQGLYRPRAKTAEVDARMEADGDAAEMGGTVDWMQ